MSTHSIIRPRHIVLAVALALGSPLAFALQTDCEVTVENDDGTGGTSGTLSWAIKTANTDVVANHPAAHPGGGCTDNTITLKTDVTLTGVMKRLINSNVTIQSEAGQRYTISGNNQFRPFFVKSGTVTIQNLNLADGLAQGGNAGRGGGGAGLGGALFVYNGDVTLEDVAFHNNTARGGSSNAASGGGGGGAFGNGTSFGGAGLFGDSNAGNGGYGGSANYGGFGGTENYGSTGGAGGFGGGGGSGSSGTSIGRGGLGGFGGGGGVGAGFDFAGVGGAGGFGGGGGQGTASIFSGARLATGGSGGFGGGGGGFESSMNATSGTPGSGGFGGGNAVSDGNSGRGGGGAGFGGAIFVKQGTLILKDIAFDTNEAEGGAGANNGDGRGGAIFICTSTESAACSATIDEDSSCGVTFTNSLAPDGELDLFWTGASAGDHSTAGLGACAPSATTGMATSITATSATLNGTVNDNDEAITAINFDYGTTNSYGTQTPATPNTLAAGEGETPVTAAIDALTCNTGYHFRVAATYADGIVNGNDANFITLACTTGPSVTTDAATSVSTDSATLNGSVTDVGSNITSIQYEFGTASGSYGAPVNATPATLDVIPGSPETINPSHTLTGLDCNTTYYYRLNATDANETNSGDERSVTTNACMTGPSLTTQAATWVTDTSATLNGTVTDVGRNVTDIGFEYGPNTSYGTTVPANITSIDSTPGSPQTVNPTANLTGLTCGGVTYHYRITATDGTAQNGLDQTFTTGACNTPPVASAVSISGTLEAGQMLTGSYTYSDADEDAESGTTFQWLRNTTDSISGASVITGATATSYTVLPNDRGNYVFFCVTPHAETGASPGAEVCSDGSLITNQPVTLTVTSHADPGTSGGCVSAPATDCSLRDAINTASNTVTDTINFAASLADQTITLSSTLEIAKNLIIDGSDRNINVSGNNAVRVFLISADTTAELKNLTVSGGDATGSDGGGLLNIGTVTLNNVTFLDNKAEFGGGFFNHAIAIDATLSNVTFVSNEADISGGGLFNRSTLALSNVTFAGNESADIGGGLVNYEGTATLANVLLANNTGDNCRIYPGSTLTDNGNNIDSGDTCGFNHATSLSDTNPLLGAFDAGTGTFPLLPGSPAIGAGNSDVCSDAATVNNRDQRGISRPQGNACDIGAYESQGFTLAKSGGDNQSTTVSTGFDNALQVTVSSADGEPVDGGMVSFAAPGTGASATLSTNTATIASGNASVTATANATAGNYQVTASTAGASNPVNFDLSNITDITVPSAPTGLSASAGNGQVSLSWTVPANNGGSTITGYAVTGSPNGSCTTTGATTCTVTGLSNGTSYSFTVVATNAIGNSPVSNTATATPVAPPPPPLPPPPPPPPADPEPVDPTPEPTDSVIPPVEDWPNLPSDDGDGIPNEVEALVPSPDGETLGDGNGDGIPDNQQTDVSSVPFRQTAEISQDPDAPVTFITLVAGSEEGTPRSDEPARLTQVTQQDAPADRPENLQMPLGLLSFTAETPRVGEVETFSLLIDGDLPINGYFKQNAAGVWVNLATHIERVDTKIRIDFAIEDGGEFDRDGEANGTIVDPGAPGFDAQLAREHYALGFMQALAGDTVRLNSRLSEIFTRILSRQLTTGANGQMTERQAFNTLVQVFTFVATPADDRPQSPFDYTEEGIDQARLGAQYIATFGALEPEPQSLARTAQRAVISTEEQLVTITGEGWSTPLPGEPHRVPVVTAQTHPRLHCKTQRCTWHTHASGRVEAHLHQALTKGHLHIVLYAHGDEVGYQLTVYTPDGQERQHSAVSVSAAEAQIAVTQDWDGQLAVIAQWQTPQTHTHYELGSGAWGRHWLVDQTTGEYGFLSDAVFMHAHVDAHARVFSHHQMADGTVEVMDTQ